MGALEKDHHHHDKKKKDKKEKDKMRPRVLKIVMVTRKTTVPPPPKKRFIGPEILTIGSGHRRHTKEVESPGMRIIRRSGFKCCCPLSPLQKMNHRKKSLQETSPQRNNDCLKTMSNGP